MQNTIISNTNIIVNPNINKVVQNLIDITPDNSSVPNRYLITKEDFADYGGVWSNEAVSSDDLFHIVDGHKCPSFANSL